MKNKVEVTLRHKRKDLTTDELWAAYHGGDMEARNALVTKYYPLVERVAKQVIKPLPSQVELDDLISDGVFGLFDAIERFDPSRGFKLETYAVMRVRGEMYDRLRAADWVPRSLRIRSKKIEAAMFDLEVDLGRKPTIEEISAFLDYDEDDTREAISLVLGSSIVGIDTPIQVDNESQDMNFSDVISDRNSDTSINHEYNELLEMFANFMSGLAQREKVIVVLYYCENKTLQQIGDILGVTESRVCQIHNKTLADLRKSCLLD